MADQQAVQSGLMSHQWTLEWLAEGHPGATRALFAIYYDGLLSIIPGRVHTFRAITLIAHLRSIFPFSNCMSMKIIFLPVQPWKELETLYFSADLRCRSSLRTNVDCRSWRLLTEINNSMMFHRCRCAGSWCNSCASADSTNRLRPSWLEMK